MPISEAVVTIGRSLDNDIILDAKHVSRWHAQLRRRYGQYVLYDLGSSGGTTVNGRPVREAPLRHGDVIRLAGVEIRFEQIDAGLAPSPRVTRRIPRPQAGKNQP